MFKQQKIQIPFQESLNHKFSVYEIDQVAEEYKVTIEYNGNWEAKNTSESNNNAKIQFAVQDLFMVRASNEITTESSMASTDYYFDLSNEFGARISDGKANLAIPTYRMDRWLFSDYLYVSLKPKNLEEKFKNIFHNEVTGEANRNKFKEVYGFEVPPEKDLRNPKVMSVFIVNLIEKNIEFIDSNPDMIKRFEDREDILRKSLPQKYIEMIYGSTDIKDINPQDLIEIKKGMKEIQIDESYAENSTGQLQSTEIRDSEFVSESLEKTNEKTV